MLMLGCLVAKAVNFIITANVGTAKVKIVNKIGKVPQGVYHDLALALQRGLRRIRVQNEPVVRWTRGTTSTREVVRALEPELFAKVGNQPDVALRLS